MKTNKTILGVIGGLAVGTVIGVLFAPNKGSKTRKRIIKKSQAASDEIIDKFDKAVHTVTDKYNSLLKKGEVLAKEGKQDLDNIQKINN
jgi:gas vesicle protein